MAMRFSKSVKICKGVRLNFSKSGVRTSVGPRGASVSFGKGGTRASVGLPGTGLSYQTRLSSGKSSSRSHAATPKPSAAEKTVAEIISYTGNPDFVFGVCVANDGAVSFVDENENVIDDANLITLLKKHPAYASQKAEIQAQSAENAANYARSLQEQTEAFLNIHTLSPEILTEGDVRNTLATVKPVLYSCISFETPAPDRKAIESELENEANSTVKAILPGKKKKLVREFVEANLDRIYQDQVNLWASQKRQHELAEAEKKSLLDKQAIEECENYKQKLQLSLAGDESHIEDEIGGWLSSIELPVSIDVSFDYQNESKSLAIDLDLPEIEDLPTTYGAQLSSGKYKEKNKTQKQLKEEYVKCVLGLTIFVVTNMFNISTAIQEVVISGYTQRRNKEGDLSDDYIISARFDRSQLAALPYSSSEPMDTILKFENRMNLTAANQFKVIKPF